MCDKRVGNGLKYRKTLPTLSFGNFGLILGTFLSFQSYNFDDTAHAGAPLGVERLC